MVGRAAFCADWVLPIEGRPLEPGWLSVEDGRILAVGGGTVDGAGLGRVVLLPGLVNAHTHLELSWLRGRVAPAAAFVEWVRTLLALRRDPPSQAEIEASLVAAVDEARRCGTVLVGDIANSPDTAPALRRTGIAARSFLELIGFSTPDPERQVAEARAAIGAGGSDAPQVRTALAAHAPYSVSPSLFHALRADLDRLPGGVCSVHAAEGPEETALLADGTGPWRTLLGELGVWNPSWRPPGTSAVAYLDALGWLDPRVLVVHGVQCSGDDLRRVRARGATLVSCPRSNAHVGAGAPPLEAFYASGVEVAFGTDSLASVSTLSLFDELAEARRLAPRVPAGRLLRSATLSGARALGFAGDYGSLEPGRKADVLAVRVPDGVTDVEEYLVSGVDPDAVSWLPT